MKFSQKILSLIALWVLAVSSAQATDPGFYMGAQIGVSNTHNKSQVIPNGGGPGSVTVSPSNSGVGARIFGGYLINDYAAFEAGYLYLSPTKYSSSALTTVSTPAIRESALDFDGEVMYHWFGIGVYGKAGIAYVRASQSGNLSPPQNNGGGGTTTGARPLIGIGATYDLTQRWVAELSLVRIISHGQLQSLDFVSLGLQYHIVDLKCGQFLC